MAEETKANLWERNRLALTLAVATVVFALVTLVRQFYYLSLPPHLFLEVYLISGLFTVLVCLSVFTVGWYTPYPYADPRMRILSAAFLAVGLLYFLSTLSFPAMPDLILVPSSNRATLFRMAARAMAALGLLLVATAPRQWRRRPDPFLYAAAIALTAAITWAVTQHEDWLPVLFSTATGPTPASDLAQVVIIGVMLVAAGLFWRQTGRASSRYFIQAIILLVFGGLAFILYQDLFGPYSLAVRLYSVAGYYCIFQAAYVANVRRPYQELERALTEVKQTDRLKDDFISGVSHDLRTPLVPLRGFLDMILAGRAGPLNPRQEEFLDHCRRSVERQAQLIDELLDYGRLRAGRLVLEREVFDLREVIQDALRVLEQMAMQRGLRIEIGLPEAPLPVEADRTKLLRVFSNLFSNAVKFNSERGLVRVEALLRDDQVAVSVEDTGPGIDPADQERVFERFWQASRQRGGSGIGLWMVREIVRLHGGRVELSSEPGRGSRFTVYLNGAVEAGARQAEESRG